MNRTTLLGALTAAALTLPAATASAADFCVAPASGCDQDKTFSLDGTGLQGALDAAKDLPGADRVLLGAATYTAPTGDGFEYSSPLSNPVEIAGAGRDQTTVTSPAGALKVMLLSASASSLHDLTVRIPDDAAHFGTGLTLQSATAHQIDVTAGAQQSAGIGYSGVLVQNATLEHAAVDIPKPLIAYGVWTSGANATVRDASISAYRAVRARALSSTVERAEIDVLGESAVEAQGGAAEVRDTLIRHTGNGGAALNAEAFSTRTSAISADGLTIVGGAYGTAFRASNAGATDKNATVDVRNTVVRGFAKTAQAQQTGTGAASVTTAFSDYDDAAGKVELTGTGSVTATDHSFVADPGFAATGDFHLSPSSPLAEAGDPAEPAAGRTDLDGLPRSRDNDGDCVRRRDIGAYEVASHEIVMKAAGKGGQAGTASTFTAAGSCDPDGDALTYEWSFGDGETGSGETVEHVYAAGGTYVAEVTATDPDGHSAAQEVEVAIEAAPVEPGPDAPGGTAGTTEPSTTSTTSTATTTPSGASDATTPVEPATTDPVPTTTPPASSDRSAPRVTKLRGVRRGRGLRIRFTLDEAAKVVVRVGRKRMTLRGKAGVNVVRVRGRGTKVTVVATDAAGNVAKVARRVRRAAG